MNTNQKKQDVNTRPKLQPCEKRGLVIIGALFIFIYVLVVMVMGGQIPAESFLLLDPTGHLQQWAQRWVNASIPYRERMTPVYIICVYFYLIVMMITFATQDWQNLTKRVTGRGSELWRFFLIVVLIMVLSAFLFIEFGEEFPAKSQDDLSRIFERQAFSNKYPFVFILFFLAALANANANAKIMACMYLKIKLLMKMEKQNDN